MAQPQSYTPKHLAERILRERAALVGERKQVTVLFVDVKGSMRLAERVGAEAWHGILDGFFALLSEAIHRFEGTINQFTGDGVMALFGAPLSHEDHAQRACHAALAICEQVRGFAAELRRARGVRFDVRLGLHSGEVIVGAIGDDLRMDYTAQGHTVGLAARMQQSAAAGRAYVSATTAALVDAFFELEPIGRAAEVAELEAAFVRASDGHGAVVGVTGAPGVGKSRLCHDAVERWRARGIQVAKAHCPAHGRTLSYAVLRELLRSFFGIAASDRPTSARKRVRSSLRELRSATSTDHALVLHFLGLASAEDEIPTLAPDARRDRLFALACGLVQSQSAREPTVVLIDDVQWIDSESELFLARLVDAVGFTRTLLLLNARPEPELPAWASASYVRALPLGPLDPAAAESLVGELVGEGPALAELRALVCERAAGNPFFAEEIAQSLFEQGVLARERSGTRLVREVREIAIPPTLTALLTARIDSLQPEAKHALQLASVIGPRFDDALLRTTLRDERLDLDEALRALERADLVGRDGKAELAFKHPLTQEVAYQSQLQEVREARHQAVARTILALHAARLGEHAAALAHHFAAGGLVHEARRWRGLSALHVTNIQLRRERR